VFPEAEVPLDRVPISKLLNEAMDQVRRQEQKEHPDRKDCSTGSGRRSAMASWKASRAWSKQRSPRPADTERNLITMIYLLTGEFEFDAPSI